MEIFLLFCRSPHLMLKTYMSYMWPEDSFTIIPQQLEPLKFNPWSGGQQLILCWGSCFWQQRAVSAMRGYKINQVSSALDFKMRHSAACAIANAQSVGIVVSSPLYYCHSKATGNQGFLGKNAAELDHSEGWLLTQCLWKQKCLWSHNVKCTTICIWSSL